MPSGKKSREARRAAQAKAPPPVRSKGAAGVRDRWLHGDRVWWVGGGFVLIVVIVVAIVLSSGGGSAKPVRVDFAQLGVLQTGPPPWNNDVGSLSNNLAALHLNALGQEGSAEHIHMHLDAYVNGTHVTLPAGVGIDGNSFLTELHTHDSSGVIHLESPNTHPYTLGQFFGEWGVRLTANCLGRYCGNLHWWVDGKPQAGNPADLVLQAHQEIAIVAGKPPAHVPASYNFPAGE